MIHPAPNPSHLMAFRDRSIHPPKPNEQFPWLQGKTQVQPVGFLRAKVRQKSEHIYPGSTSWLPAQPPKPPRCGLMIPPRSQGTAVRGPFRARRRVFLPVPRQVQGEGARHLHQDVGMVRLSRSNAFRPLGWRAGVSRPEGKTEGKRKPQGNKRTPTERQTNPLFPNVNSSWEGWGTAACVRSSCQVQDFQILSLIRGGVVGVAATQNRRGFSWIARSSV